MSLLIIHDNAPPLSNLALVRMAKRTNGHTTKAVLVLHSTVARPAALLENVGSNR